jgi:hypothetical protein
MKRERESIDHCTIKIQQTPYIFYEHIFTLLCELSELTIELMKSNRKRFPVVGLLAQFGTSTFRVYSVHIGKRKRAKKLCLHIFLQFEIHQPVVCVWKSITYKAKNVK